MMAETPSSAQSAPVGRRFARRVYPARILGLGLGFFAVGAALIPLSHGFWVWFLLIMYAFAWPHIAYLYATRVSDSFATGKRQLLFDSFCGGLWVAAMACNLLPSAVVLTMLSMNNMATSGMRFFWLGCVSPDCRFAVGGGDLWLASAMGQQPHRHYCVFAFFGCASLGGRHDGLQFCHAPARTKKQFEIIKPYGWPDRFIQPPLLATARCGRI